MTALGLSTQSKNKILFVGAIFLQCSIRAVAVFGNFYLPVYNVRVRAPQQMRAATTAH